jgi:hypothetical protein
VKNLSAFTLIITMFLTIGCNKTSVPPAMPAKEVKLVDRIEEGIERLNAGIDGLDQRIAALQANPSPTHHFRELETLDLAAWQLRRQQWGLQRDRLKQARELLRAVTHEAGRNGLAERWLTEDQHFAQQLEDLRRQRDEIERERLKTEGRLIEHQLR